MSRVRAKASQIVDDLEEGENIESGHYYIGRSTKGGEERGNQEFWSERAFDASPRVFVLAASHHAGDELAQRLPIPSVVLTLAQLLSVDFRHVAPDVVLVRIPAGDLDLISVALSARTNLREPEYVFVVESPANPACSALIAVGIKRVLVMEDVSQWIAEAALPLAKIARACAALREARAEVPPLPETGANSSDPPRGLFEAERRFRETYVRVLMAKMQLRTQAAEYARVPYRTFFQIVRKLGIEVERQKRAASEVQTNSLW